APLETIPEERIKRDREFWQQRVDGMIGAWLTEETPVQTVAEFVEKVYVRKDLSGFRGDARFVQNDHSQKMFSKFRSSIAGVYNWRLNNSKSPQERERMKKEADFAFRQAFAICPTSPEVLFRYVNLLLSEKRIDEALWIGEAARKASPENN